VPVGVHLVERGEHTLLTVLTYRHSHFGPQLAGPLRRLFPSPRQSNWRLYVDGHPEGKSAERVVLFIKNIFDSPVYGLGSRCFSDALPSHVAGRFEHRKTADGYHTSIESGGGSAPAFALNLALQNQRALPDEFGCFFSSWEDAVAWLSLQDAAIAQIAGTTRIALAGIDLPIDLQTVQPATAIDQMPGQFLRDLGVNTPPFCFVVPGVHFQVLWEKILDGVAAA
jgi:hypothetical protein